jgi:poly(hydroxyalkanoate) depolymerase family esterase
MTLRARTSAFLGLVLLGLMLPTLAAPHAAAAEPGTFTESSYGTGADAREFWTYVPSSAPTQPRALVVALHGCTQTAPDFATGSRWNALAEAAGFVVVYPEQSAAANGTQCWNWFLPEHQVRGAGEPGTIAGITQQAIAAHGIDPSRVYVTGVSAGADMTAILAATYPDLYAAVAPFAGCAYSTCADVAGTLAYAQMGPRARVVPAMVMQGTADVLNNFALGETLAAQAVATNDLADDGEDNDSVPDQPTSTEHVGLDESFVSNAGTAGDTCVRNHQFPCAGGVVGAESYPYSIERHADATGCSVVDFWIVHGLGHDYPGGDPAGTFTDPIGPDATREIWKFFGQHRLGSPCYAAAEPVVPEVPAVALLPVLAAITGAGWLRRRRA